MWRIRCACSVSFSRLQLHNVGMQSLVSCTAHKLLGEIIRVARILDSRPILCIFNSFSLFSLFLSHSCCPSAYISLRFRFFSHNASDGHVTSRQCEPACRSIGVCRATAYFILIASWAGPSSVCNNHPVWAGSKRETTSIEYLCTRIASGAGYVASGD